MKKLLVIGGESSESEETRSLAAIADYVREGISQYSHDVQVDHCNIQDIGFVVTESGNSIVDMNTGHDIARNDLIVFRGRIFPSINQVTLIAEYLKSKNVRFVASAYADRRAISKVAQMFQFASIGCRVPKTVTGHNSHIPELIEKHLQYPVVCKAVNASHGRDNYLVKNKEELLEILSKSPDLTFMAQEFIKNDGDYRILIVGDEHLIIHRQAIEGSHLNNTSAGASAKLVDAKDVPAEVIKQAHDIARTTHYEITGVDAIISTDTGKHYFLEINSQPQLLTGAVTAEKQDLIGKYFAELLAD